MEFFQRQDAHNVFDYLWPNDLLSLSSTCRALRENVNSYSSRKDIATPSTSKSNADDYPAICRYLRWWLRRCIQCENEMEISECLNLKNRGGFIPQSLKNYTLIPICSKDCAFNWPYLMKITKTDAKSRYSLNEKELSGIPHTAKRNPVFRSAAPMKLFYESEVELVAMSKFKVGSRHELHTLLNQRREKRATRTEEIRRTKQLSKDEREKELRSELEKQGLELRSDSQIAEWYITNSKRGFPLTRSVELIRRAHIVHQHVGDFYRNHLEEAYQDLKQDYYHDHETWSDMWQDEKLSVEEKAIQLFSKAKQNPSLTEIRKCECGEPLFDADELETMQLVELKKLQKQLKMKADQKKANKLKMKLANKK